MQASDAEIKTLMEENNRLRKVMMDAAGKMGPEARQRFIKDYEKIAESAQKLGLQVDTDLTKAATEVANPTSSGPSTRLMSKGPGALPDLSKAPRPPSFASFPSSGSSSNKQAEAIDSKGYLMDIMNLSVDLDPEDDNDKHVVSGNQTFDEIQIVFDPHYDSRLEVVSLPLNLISPTPLDWMLPRTLLTGRELGG